MKNTTFGKFVSLTAACLLAATAARAGTAIWQGGATGDINNQDNWNSGANIAADVLNFGGDVTATMTQDTAVFNLFGNKTTAADFTNRTVTFDMGGHTLCATHADGANKQYITGNMGTTYVFTNGVFLCAPANHSRTNSIYTSSSTTSNMTIVAIGESTTLASTFALSHGRNLGLHILNGAKAYGNSFSFGSSGKIANKAEVRFSGSSYIGTLDYNVNSEASRPPNGSRVVVDDATLASDADDPATKGSILVGNGNYTYDNTLVAMNGATIAARNIHVGAGGVAGNVLYTSSNNTFHATGAGTTVRALGDTSGGIVTCGNGYSSSNLLLVDGGATLEANYIRIGLGNANYAPSNNVFRISGAGTTVSVPNTVRYIRCGENQSIDNAVIVEDGATASAPKIYAGYGAATNNTFRATGAGTTVTAPIYVGGEDGNCTASSGNKAILEDGATATCTKIWVNVFGTGNSMSIRSGAAATVSGEIYFGASSPAANQADNGTLGRFEVVGEGTTLTCGSSFVIRNTTGDASLGQEFIVADGASVTGSSSNGFRMVGDGNRVVVSNGTLAVNVLLANGLTVSSGSYSATNSTFRIVGASAKLTATATKDVVGTSGRLVGAPIFEFVIPEGGWAEAPVAINQAFTIGDDTIIRIDAAAARKYARSGGGTVPLISTGTSGKSITANVSALTSVASLPEGCSLEYADGVLSVKVKGQSGLSIFVR